MKIPINQMTGRQWLLMKAREYMSTLSASEALIKAVKYARYSGKFIEEQAAARYWHKIKNNSNIISRLIAELEN